MSGPSDSFHNEENLYSEDILQGDASPVGQTSISMRVETSRHPSALATPSKAAPDTLQNDITSKEDGTTPLTRDPLLPTNGPKTKTSQTKRKQPEPDNSDLEEFLFDNSKRLVPGSVFPNEVAMLEALRAQFKSLKGIITFNAGYQYRTPIPDDASKSKLDELDKSKAHELAHSIWEATKRRWTIKENRAMKYGFYTKWYCCQDSKHRRAPKKKCVEGVKNRDKMPKRTFECASEMFIRVERLNEEEREVHVILEHNIHHPAYYDVAIPPEALQFIKERLDCTPSAITAVVKRNPKWKHVQPYQVRHIWKQLNQDQWRKDEDQLKSARILLTQHAATVDTFKLEEIEGVVSLAFGLKRVAERLKDLDIVEVGLDATYNTNAKDLEMYGLLAEHDNAGLPVAYMFLSTATSIEKNKRMRIITSFLSTIRNRYALSPRFVHTDKDPAEIAAAKSVWPESKHQLCRWHMNKAVTDRCRLRRLATTKYDAVKAHEAYRFISKDWKPRVRSNSEDDEGDEPIVEEPTAWFPGIPYTFGASQATGPNHIPPLRLPPRPPGATQPTLTQTRRVEVEEESSAEEEEVNESRVFCPERLRASVIKMMSSHGNAHPSIHGDYAPSGEGIREWAVRKAYDFCRAEDLPELWAYLWGNWYRWGRWQLWTRGPCEEIPRLRTTMLVESHWRHLKKDWLDVWPKMRLDMLVFTLSTHVAAKYENLVDLIICPSGLARDRASWRDEFKKAWKECEKTATSAQDKFPYLRYDPDPHRWICGCPAYKLSRFLICKHLILLCHPVSPWFFLDVNRNRVAPFYAHPSLVPMSDEDGNPTVPPVSSTTSWSPDNETAAEIDDFDDEAPIINFAEKMEEMAQQLEGLASYARHQIPFGQKRSYQQFLNQTSRSLKFYQDIKERERLNNSQQGKRPGTWEKPHLINVYNHLLYSGFDPELLDSGSVDPSLLDEWAGVQGFWHSVQSDKPTPSRQHVEPKVSGSPTYGVASSYATPTSAPLLNQYDLAKLHRRDTFSSNVCPISVQTTVYISMDGASTLTLSSIVGPRPTGIPGDTGTPDGTDTTGGESGTGTTGGQSFGNKEGLITGLVIVLLILLASLCSLCVYFYKKRRNARLQRMSAQPRSDTADTVRQMGSKGLMSLSNSARSFSRSRRWSQWSPLAVFRGLVSRLKPSSRRNPKRDSQSSELLDRERRMEQTDRGNTAGWSVAGNSAAEPDYSEKHLGAQPTEKGSSDNTIPEIISSPALSSLRLPSPPKPAARLSAGGPSSVDYGPLAARRVSPNYRPSRSALQPIAVEPVRQGSIPDFGRDASSRRNSHGEPLSPGAWMAGFGLASGSHVDPFTSPSYASPSGYHHDYVQSISKISDPGSPLSNAHSSGSGRTLRGRKTSPQRYNHERLSAVIEPSDVRPDGASDIISTFGDRPSSHHTVSTIDDDRHLSESQLVRYHPLSDVEEVLAPVADERLSMQPGSAPFTWRETRDSFGQRSARNAFADSNASPSLPPPMSRGRRPVPLRRKSEATSLQGGFLPSEKSASNSLAGTSIVDLGPPIDTGDWDDDASRRREEDQLFYIRPESAASNRLALAFPHLFP